jgi:hypothetical protein
MLAKVTTVDMPMSAKMKRCTREQWVCAARASARTYGIDVEDVLSMGGYYAAHARWDAWAHLVDEKGCSMLSVAKISGWSSGTILSALKKIRPIRAAQPPRQHLPIIVPRAHIERKRRAMIGSGAPRAFVS